MGVDALIGKWTERARKLREWAAAEDAARAWEAAAKELERVVAEAAEQLLNLQQAATTSGYSPEHLGRLVREGRIPNAGRPNAPRIRSGDLPRKPGAPATPITAGGPPPAQVTVVRRVIDSRRQRVGGRAA